MAKPDTKFSGPALCALPAREVVSMLRKGEVAPAEALDAALARIQDVEPAVNATVTLCETRAHAAIDALAARKNADHPGCLAGLPIAIKDLTPVSGVRTTFGNMGLKDFVPEESDPLVDMMEARGAVIVGKTNTPEFGAGGNTFNAVFGATRNPWDTRKNAGGSSGGAAVSLATGEVWLSQGSDYGGSLRTPANYCGVVGLRPSIGRCGGGAKATAFLGEGVSGPMARDVRDLALFLDHMSGFIAEQPLSVEAPKTPFQQAVAQADEKIRIAFAPDLNGFCPLESEIRTILTTAMDKVSASGATVDAACPDLAGLDETFRTLRGITFATNYATLPESVTRHFKATLRQNMAEGLALTADDIFRAERQRTILFENTLALLKTHDVLAFAVNPLEPGVVEEEYPTHIAGEEQRDYLGWLRFAFLATVTGLPALSLPVGFTRSGMPVGIQLLGPPRGEAKLLAVAHAIETVLALKITPIDPIIRHARAGGAPTENTVWPASRTGAIA